MSAVGTATVAGGFRRGLRSDNALKFMVCFRRFSVNKISNIEEWLYHMKENGWMISIIIFNFFMALLHFWSIGSNKLQITGITSSNGSEYYC